MNQKLEKELIQIIENDEWMIHVLKIVRDLNLKDCWIGAGFVRNKIWDVKHHKSRTKLNDIDVIYFDKSNTSKERDEVLENKLKENFPKLNWSVKNQARMHIKNGQNPYKDCEEAISFWPETATSIAVRINSRNKIEYIAPYGLDDLFQLKVKPSPKCDLKIYKSRIEKKGWKEIWNKLEIEFKK
ncbi:nucleotidyltransferase family protein [Aureivirga sp. CE67]|uniref:nucleotidyltransferase family protein n=1 Tax=Aureivirga sp. CE67 TaxID=1788983 RepID=UPI0018C9DC95|nr:nucleotidyltransferase family protein [Aureivirga sp. CE67]